MLLYLFVIMDESNLTTGVKWNPPNESEKHILCCFTCWPFVAHYFGLERLLCLTCIAQLPFFNLQNAFLPLKSETLDLEHRINWKDFYFDGDPWRTAPCSPVDSSFITLSCLVPLFTVIQTPESSHALWRLFHLHFKGQPQRPSPIKNSGKHLNLAVYPDLNLPQGRLSLITSLGGSLLGQSFLRNVPSVTLMA